MNFSSRLRKITGLLAVTWAVLAIGVAIFSLFDQLDEPVLPLDFAVITGHAVVQSATPKARAAGIRPGDQILSIDGKPALSPSATQSAVREGRPSRYEIRAKEGTIFEVSLAPVARSSAEHRREILMCFALLGVAILYLLVAGVVWWNKPDQAATWALLLFSSVMAVLLATSVRAGLTPWWSWRTIATLPWVGATAFHLFTTYPTIPGWIRRFPGTQFAVYLSALALSVVVSGSALLGNSSEWIARASYFYGSGLAFVAVGVLISERRRAHDLGLGDRADILLAASAVSFLPSAIIGVGEFFGPAPLPWYAGLLSFVFFPFAVGYGMLRRELFDFRLAEGSSATYALVSLAITGGFAFVVAFADQIVSVSGVRVQWVQFALLFLAILAFNPLRHRTQRLVDRVFDRDRARYRLAVGEISEAMVSMISTNEIGERILTALLDTMGVGRAMVFVAGEQDEVLRAGVWRGDWREPMADIVVTKDHPLWEHLRQHRSVLSRRALEDDPESAEFFDRLGVELLVPILYGNDLLGAIAVGQKRTGDRLAGADRQLLQTLANQGAIAIENARAFDEIAKLNETLEARVETRTRELRETQDQLMQSEKLKSMGQLVAGVAHELNNPIGFVHSNIQLLDEYVGRLLEGPGDEAEAKQIRDTIAKLLLRSREGAQRVKQIVEDLRTFSRTDQAAIEEVDLHEELDRTLALMEPRFKHKIEVERRYGELPRVRCYPGQLNQVFLNLLMNAGDAMEGHGRVTVRTRPWVRGVRIDFEDSGPGIEPEVLGRLFDPFFTTKEVGQGTGLGLSISHSIVERHGGRIYAASRPDRGAIFSIEIPLDAPAPDE